jgi:beta-1,4-mannosyltransferase
MRVTTIVLGDLGRSPRMQYHAEALAAHDIDVDVIACAGSHPHATLRTHPRITCHLLPPVRERSLPRALRVPAALCKVVVQAARLVWMLAAVVRKPDLILVQSPPAIPTLLIVLAAARVRGARLVVDWHNVGWSVLALGIGPRHPVVAVARWYERALARRADAHLCVSDALAAEVMRWGTTARIGVLRDRPAARFRPLDRETRGATRQRLLDSLGLAARAPAIVVSPTSWTRDEDFPLLLDALRRAETRVAERRFPDVLVLITGRGPCRAAFESQAAALVGRRFHVRTAWLDPDDYPDVLAASDLGLSLHRSASGLDLPMKIADMQGAGLPVCAFDYGACLDEMLCHGDTGLRFADAGALAGLLVSLLAGFPDRTPELDRLRANVDRRRGSTWRDGWEREAREILLGHG